MTCKFSIGRRFSIDNLRIVDWLDNFRNTDFHRIVSKLNTSPNSTRRGERLPSLCECLFGSTPRRPWELRITTIQKPMMSMPSTISAGLYLKSVQTCDKSTDPWSWTLLFGVLAWMMRPLSDSIILWGQSWTQLDSRFVFNDSLRVEFSSIFWHLIIVYKVSSSMDLERISTKDISPESFEDSSVDSTRHYFGPTRKIYVYFGILCACPHFMDHTCILGNQFRKDPVLCTFLAAYHKLEEHRS